MTTKTATYAAIMHYLLLLAMLAVALYHGQTATAQLTTAFDPDLYRDIGQAYTIFYGDWLSDPQLSGEMQWYNPLTAALIAGMSAAFELDPATTYVRAGAYLGLLAPLAFYLCLRCLLNPSVALVAVATFIFISAADPQIPYPASYSPWLHSWKLAQVFFYLALTCIFGFIQRGSLHLMLAGGLLWGLCFLTHFYPAILLGAICLVCATMGKIRWSQLLYMMVLAFLVGLPFVWSIVFHYQMNVVNSLVVEWVYDDLQELLPYLLLYVNWQLPLVLAGGWVLQRRYANADANTGAGLLAIWACVVLGSVVYSSLWHNIKDLGLYLPPLTFSIHTSFYLSAVLSMLFAVGTVSGLQTFASNQCRNIPVEIAAVLIILVLYLPTYGNRAAFTQWPQFARYNQQFFENTGFSEWLHSTTDSDNVILAAPTQSLSMVVSHGRKVVAGPALWSNPYVDMQQRLDDQEKMFAALADKDWASFFTLAEHYEVDYLLSLGDSWEQGLDPQRFSIAHQGPGLNIYSLDGKRQAGN